MNSLTAQTTNQLQTADITDVMNRWTHFIEGTPRTVESYTRAIGQFQKWCSTNNVSQPTKEDIRCFRDELNTRCKPTTVNAYLSACKCFFRWTAEEQIYPDIAQNVKSVKLSKGHRKDELTAAQAKTLLGSIDRTTLNGKRDFAIISVMLTTGMRDIEIMRADIGDLRPLGDFTALYYQGKGRHEKTAFKKIAPVVEAAIRDYLSARGSHADEDPLFISMANRNKGNRLTTKSISRIVKGRLRDAGFDSSRWTAHSLRHTAAMIALLNGTPIEEIQSMMDHESITTTMIYAGHASKAARQAEQNIASALF